MQNNLAKNAAAWWVEQIKKHCSKKHPTLLTDEVFLKKLSHLEELLILEIDKRIQNKSILYLGCYHFPTYELSRIAKVVNFHHSYFPPDIEMQILGEDITVSVNSHPLRQLRI